MFLPLWRFSQLSGLLVLRTFFFHLTILIWYTFFFHENTFLWVWTWFNTKIRVNTMLDSSLRIGILNNYDFEMITCYLKAPTVDLMKFQVPNSISFFSQFLIWIHFIFLFEYGLTKEKMEQSVRKIVVRWVLLHKFQIKQYCTLEMFGPQGIVLCSIR